VRNVQLTEEKARRKNMSKTMGRTIAGHNLKVTMVIAALAVVPVVLILVAVVQAASTTSDRSTNPAMSAEGKGASSFNYEPDIDRHAEVVQRLVGSSLR
jgi:uncharacterized membrane protein YdfJ with MMPL/SSD domain